VRKSVTRKKSILKGKGITLAEEGFTGGGKEHKITKTVVFWGSRMKDREGKQNLPSGVKGKTSWTYKAKSRGKKKRCTE